MTTTPESPADPTERPAGAQLVYRFGAGQADGSAAMRELLGGKGAGLAEMNGLGIPVPPGFTITTEVCAAYYALGESYPPELAADIVDRGIVLAGGGSLLKNLDVLLRTETGLPVMVCDDPMCAVIRGIGGTLDKLDLLHRIAVS